MTDSTNERKRKSSDAADGGLEDGEDEVILPQGWEKRLSRSSSKFAEYSSKTVKILDRVYFFNVYTGKSQWTRPTKNAEEDVKIPNKVRCFHILVKHEKSRNPKSWRSDRITRTREEAQETLECNKFFIQIKLVRIGNR